MAEGSGDTTSPSIKPSQADILASAQPEANPLSTKEVAFYEARTLAAKLEALELENTQLKNDIEDRKSYAGKIFILICLWLFAVLLIVVVVGCKGMTLSDTVLVALITTTTINVLGLFLVVANYLFYRAKKEVAGTGKKK